MNFETLRADVPALEAVTYMNYGASGPSPRRVVDAVESFLEYHEFETPAVGGMYPAADEAYGSVREAVSSFIGTDPELIALTQSTTDGINRFACSIEWEPGATIVRTDLEHPAGILPWQRLERRRDVEVRVVPTVAGRPDMDVYLEAVEGADLVSFSAVTWTHGTLLPVRTMVDIAHDAGARVIVDGVQAPGQIPVDVESWGADAVAAAGHKWLLGPWGAGFLYVVRPVAESLIPGSIGYRSVAEPTGSSFELLPGARRFEVGTINPAPHMGLREAIAIAEEMGVDRIQRRIHRLAARLVDAVPEDRLLSPEEPETGLVTVEVDDPTATVERLATDGIVVRRVPIVDAVRVSIHAINTEGEVDDLIDALRVEW